MIATVESLGERSIEELKRPSMARESGIEGVFILISKKERKIQVLVSQRYPGRDDEASARRDPNRPSSRDFATATLTEGLEARRRRDRRIAARWPSAPASFPESRRWRHSPASTPARPSPARSARAPQPGAADSLRAHGADRGRAGESSSLKLKVNIAVVDDGGHLIAFERMDGARPASGYTAITKATSAATFRQSSGPLPAGAPAPIRF